MRLIVGKNSQPSERKLFFGNFLFGILVAIARGEAKRRGSRTSILNLKVVFINRAFFMCFLRLWLSPSYGSTVFACWVV